MKMQVTVLNNNIPDLVEQMRQNAGMATRRAALKAVERAQEAMRAPKSGHFYGTHQASAPGQAPAVQSGGLIGSIEAQKVDAYIWNVGSIDDKAPILEFGSVNMEARPFLGPAADEVWEEFEGDMKRILEG